jgi:tetratricopeptide (TPR) repeat protein
MPDLLVLRNALRRRRKLNSIAKPWPVVRGVLRRITIARSITKAVEQKQTDLDNLLRLSGTVSDETKAKIETAKAELAQFQKIESEFSKNKDYDALIAYRIGLCLLELKLPWEAFVAFRDIFDNSPSFTKVTGVYYYYILALKEIGRNTEAQAMCKEFLQKFPEAEQVSEIAVILGSISQDREENIPKPLNITNGQNKM